MVLKQKTPSKLKELATQREKNILKNIIRKATTLESPVSSILYRTDELLQIDSVDNSEQGIEPQPASLSPSQILPLIPTQNLVKINYPTLINNYEFFFEFFIQVNKKPFQTGIFINDSEKDENLDNLSMDFEDFDPRTLQNDLMSKKIGRFYLQEKQGKMFAYLDERVAQVREKAVQKFSDRCKNGQL